MTASWNLASLRICASKRCRHIDAMDVRSLTSYAAGIAAGRVRRSDFNQDLSTAGACSNHTPKLAGPNQVTEYRRIGFPASGVDSAFRNAAACSSCKQQGYSDAAG
jgi:hypothetical protein